MHPTGAEAVPSNEIPPLGNVFAPPRMLEGGMRQVDLPSDRSVTCDAVHESGSWEGSRYWLYGECRGLTLAYPFVLVLSSPEPPGGGAFRWLAVAAERDKYTKAVFLGLWEGDAAKTDALIFNRRHTTLEADARLLKLAEFRKRAFAAALDVRTRRLEQKGS